MRYTVAQVMAATGLQERTIRGWAKRHVHGVRFAPGGRVELTQGHVLAMVEGRKPPRRSGSQPVTELGKMARDNPDAARVLILETLRIEGSTRAGALKLGTTDTTLAKIGRQLGLAMPSRSRS